MTLRRIPTNWGHKYTLDGKPVPGVTTILKKGIPMPALPRWAAKSCAEYVADNLDAITNLPDRESRIAVIKQSPWTQRDRAAVNGTEVHGYAEQLVHGQAVEVPAPLGGYVDACARFLDEWQAEPILTEFVIGNRQWWYAGTGDLLARLPDGRQPIVDWKTGSGIYAETSLQLSGYAFAEFYLDDQGLEQPMPEADEIGYGVLLGDDGTYAAHALPVTEWAFKRFLYAKQIAEFADASKQLVGEAVQPPALTLGVVT